MMNRIYKLIPRRCLLPLVLVVAFNMLSYYGGMLLSGLFPMHDWTLALDRLIPLSPLWTVIYVSSFPLWFINYVRISRDHDQMVYRLAAADITGKLIALAFFVFLPTTLEQPSLEGLGAEAFLLRVIYFFDQPVNLFPSLHCFMSWLSFRPMLDCKGFKWFDKAFALVLCLLIFVSTLTTKQHVFVDVLGGWALAEVCYDLAPRLPAIRLLRRVNRRFDPTLAQ